jgi:hypothetical protein
MQSCLPQEEADEEGADSGDRDADEESESDEDEGELNDEDFRRYSLRKRSTVQRYSPRVGDEPQLASHKRCRNVEEEEEDEGSDGVRRTSDMTSSRIYPWGGGFLNNTCPAATACSI